MKPSAGVRAIRSSSSRRPRWAAIAKRPYSTKEPGSTRSATFSRAVRPPGGVAPLDRVRPRRVLGQRPAREHLGEVLALGARHRRTRRSSPIRTSYVSPDGTADEEGRMAELATYELEGRIATIAMDDGKVNALSIEMLKAVLAALDRAEEDEAVVVLTGREKFFSAGLRPRGLLRAARRDRRDADPGRAALGAHPLLPDAGAGRLQRPRDRRRHLPGARRRPADRRRGPLQARPQRGQDRPHGAALRGRARPPAPHPRATTTARW